MQPHDQHQTDAQHAAAWIQHHYGEAAALAYAEALIAKRQQDQERGMIRAERLTTTKEQHDEHAQNVLR